MSRLAILIDAGGQEGDKCYLPGAAADVRSLRSFLLSNLGGAWQDHEIVTLKNPSELKLRLHLATAKSNDYCFVAASGHGHHVMGQGINETRFCCNEHEEISARDLNSGSKRCTVLLDCCRKLTIIEDFSILESRSKSIAKYAADRSSYLYRSAFDSALGATEIGCCYLFSCDLHQSAQESQNGGYYTQAFVDSAIRWHDMNTNRSWVFSICDAHRDAVRIVQNRHPQQIPQSGFGMRLSYFPFAVIPTDSMERSVVRK